MTVLSHSSRRILEAEAERRGLVITRHAVADRFEQYQTDPARYCLDELAINLWSGRGVPGQLELANDIGASIDLQLRGERAPKIFRCEAGHGVGKTYFAAALVNFFFDCFAPSITITTAPTDDQVRLLLWKDIKAQRAGLNLPGRVLPDEPKMSRGVDWFAIGRTTSDNQGRGTARMQGQHPKHWLYVVDEAEGVPEFVFGAIDAMTTGGRVGIVLMIGNPQTRTSKFHKVGKQSGVKNYRLSVLDHPNVVDGREVVPGATRREWVIEKILEMCDVVDKHNEDDYTFTVPYVVSNDRVTYAAGTIFKPNPEFCFRVLGVAPANADDRSFISPGRYEAALGRTPTHVDKRLASIGVDCARFGKDAGTVYINHASEVWRGSQVYKADNFAYLEAIRDAARSARGRGASALSIRVDGTGGFGGGIVDLARADEWLRSNFQQITVHEVQFGSSPSDEERYRDKVTELYAQAAESLLGLSLVNPPSELETDLTERFYEFVNVSGRIVKKLQDKEKFRLKNKRSPDDGDGFVLAAAPEFIFDTKKAVTGAQHVTTMPEAAPAAPAIALPPGYTRPIGAQSDLFDRARRG